MVEMSVDNWIRRKTGAHSTMAGHQTLQTLAQV